MSKYKSLEVFKFCLCLGIPIALTAWVVYKPHHLQEVIRRRAYIVYPPEGPRPPGLEEIQEMMRKEKEQQQ